MKATVIKAFLDVDGAALKKGDSVDMSEGRLNALMALGYVKAEEKAEEPKKATRRTKKAEG